MNRVFPSKKKAGEDILGKEYEQNSKLRKLMLCLRNRVHHAQSLKYEKERDGLQMSRGWRDLVAIALNAVLGIWGFFLQEKSKAGECDNQTCIW